MVRSQSFRFWKTHAFSRNVKKLEVRKNQPRCEKIHEVKKPRVWGRKSCKAEKIHVCSGKKLQPFVWGYLSSVNAILQTTLVSAILRFHGSATIWKHERGVAALFVKTRERRGSSFSQLGLEPNHTGLTAQSLFFLEESCRVKRGDTQTFSNFSNYFKRVLKLQKRSSSFSK